MNYKFKRSLEKATVYRHVGWARAVIVELGGLWELFIETDDAKDHPPTWRNPFPTKMAAELAAKNHMDTLMKDLRRIDKS